MTEQEQIESFATNNRLHTRLDECGDKIIPGKRGMLYFDGNELCLMALDRKPAKMSTWKSTGGCVWLGDISVDDNGKRVQDVKITGITNPKAAIRLAGVRPIRQISDAERARLASIRPAEKRPL